MTREQKDFLISKIANSGIALISTLAVAFLGGGVNIGM